MKFECCRCNQTFTRKSNLIHHLKIKPTENFCNKNNIIVEYRCNHCNMTYKRSQYADHINNYYSCKNYNKKLTYLKDNDPDIKKLEIQLEIEKQRTKREVEKTKQLQMTNGSVNTGIAHSTVNSHNNNGNTYNIYNQAPQFTPLSGMHFGQMDLRYSDLGDMRRIGRKLHNYIVNQNKLFYICRDKARGYCSYVDIDYELKDDNNNIKMKYNIIILNDFCVFDEMQCAKY